MNRPEYRIPRAQTSEVADRLADYLGIDPESVRCDFQHGTIEVVAEVLDTLLNMTKIMKAQL